MVYEPRKGLNWKIDTSSFSKPHHFVIITPNQSTKWRYWSEKILFYHFKQVSLGLWHYSMVRELLILQNMARKWCFCCCSIHNLNLKRDKKCRLIWWEYIEVVFHWGCIPKRLSSIEVVFNWCHLPLRSSAIEVVFHCGFLPLLAIFGDLEQFRFFLSAKFFLGGEGGCGRQGWRDEHLIYLRVWLALILLFTVFDLDQSKTFPDGGGWGKSETKVKLSQS